MHRYFKRIAGVGNGKYIYYWQSKGLSDERINYIRTLSYGITPSSDYYGTKSRVEFNGLKQDSLTFNHKRVVNIYIVYEMSKSIIIVITPHLKIVYLDTKNADIERYGYSGY